MKDTAHKKSRGSRGLSQDEAQRIFKLRAEGKSALAISEETGHHRATVTKYLKESVDGYALTPIDERVRLLRERMTATVEFDIVKSLTGSYVLLDEYEKKLAENVALDRVPSITDAGELKKIVDAKATILKLPKEIGAHTNDIYDQIKNRMKQAAEEGMDIGSTDFRVIEEQATGDLIDEGANISTG